MRWEPNLKANALFSKLRFLLFYSLMKLQKFGVICRGTCLQNNNCWSNIWEILEIKNILLWLCQRSSLTPSKSCVAISCKTYWGWLRQADMGCIVHIVLLSYSHSKHDAFTIAGRKKEYWMVTNTLQSMRRYLTQWENKQFRMVSDF